MRAAKEGTIVREDTIRGRKITFRYPKWRDFRGCMELENALHAQNAFLPHRAMNERMACDRMGKILADLETDRAAHIFVEARGRVVGRGSVEIAQGFRTGTVGIAIIGEYQGRGIGGRLMQLLDNEALKLGVQQLYLNVWSVNLIAQRLYKRCGYVEVGRLADWIGRDDLPGGRTDLVEMIKKL